MSALSPETAREALADHIRPDPLAHIRRSCPIGDLGLRAEPKYHLPRGSRNPN